MRFPRIVPLFFCVAVSSIRLFAQSPNANINGLVSDSSSAALGGAEIVAVNDVTGVQYTTKTNSEGIYVLPSLPPGPYRLQVSKIGFKTVIKPDILLNVQDALSINFALPIGAVFEVLTVEGGAPLVNTKSAAVSTVVDQTYVKNMPLNGRSFQDLILLAPGVVTQSPQVGGGFGLGQTGEFSVNGQRAESNYYTVDGISANVGISPGINATLGAGPAGSVAASTALGTTQALVNVDALQEFRVQSSTYSAEYGRNPGGQFAFETKSGTNQLHGTAYDYLRNGALDAQDWFNDYFGLKEPALRQNDFGGTLGGSVEIPRLYDGKDHTFFFLSYEGLRLISPQHAVVSLVPDALLRARTPAPLNNVLSSFPIQSPNGIDDTASGVAQFIGTWSNPSSINSTSVRIDHTVDNGLSLFFRLSLTASTSKSRGLGAAITTPTIANSTAYAMHTYTLGANSVLSDHISNEIRLNYSSNAVTNLLNIDAFGGSTPVDLAQLAGVQPDANVQVLFFLNGGIMALAQLRATGVQRQWNLVDTMGLNYRRHQFKLGVDYRRLAPSAIQPSPAFPYFYFSKSSVEMNSGFIQPQAFAPDYPLYKNFSAFAQDEWRVLPRMSLSFGLRWEMNPAPGVTQGLKPYTIRGSSPSTWTLAPQGTPLWHTTWYNFAPRVGAAYVLHQTSGRETILRSGAGVYFDTGQQLGSLSFNGPGLSLFGAFQPISFPGSPIVPTLLNPPVAPFGTVYGFASHLQLPYTVQWNASIEQALGKSQAVTVSYVGSYAARLLQENEFATPNNPNSTNFFTVQNGLTADYDSLQMQFWRRLTQGLTVLSSYTWSHCLDYGSSNFSIGYQRGNCDFDIRHNFSAAFSYDLPNVGHDGFFSALLHQWGVDERFTARTAFPANLLGNPLLQPNGQIFNGGLNLVPGQPIYLYGTNCDSTLQALNDLEEGQGCPGGRAINPQAFSVATSGLGDAPRNFARGFGEWQMNMAIRRGFSIHERVKLQFRAEAFNIFNHPNFGTINPNFGQATFGQAITTLASSLGVLNPLYQTGGSRSMQFALRLAF